MNRCFAALTLSVLVSACTIAPPANDAVIRESVIETALGQIGRPYHYGGADPSGFDCSGLVQYSYALAGVKVPRTARDLMDAGKHISLHDARPGDLLFYRFDDKGDALHVAIYLGEGQMVHAPESGRQVTVIPLDPQIWSDRFVAAVRIVP